MNLVRFSARPDAGESWSVASVILVPQADSSNKRLLIPCCSHVRKEVFRVFVEVWVLDWVLDQNACLVRSYLSELFHETHP